MNPQQARVGQVLANSTSARQSADREFNATLQLDNYNQRKQQEQIALDQQEAQYYERINKEAETLLGPDKERIQMRARKMQNSIKEKIAMYGGDKKRFFANGGSKMLTNFSNDVIGSEEFTMFQQNKANMVKIIDAKEKGLGHLLLPKDIQSLKAYEQNKGGKITYNGVMSDIEMPDPNNYDIGQDIPLRDILGHKQNYLRILGNYKMHHPDDENPDEFELLAFMDAQGYGQKGSNREMQRLKQKLALAKGKATKEPKANPDKRQIDVLTATKKTMSLLPSDSRVNDFYDTKDETYSSINKFSQMASESSYIRDISRQGKWEQDSIKYNLDEEGVLDWTNDGTKTSFMDISAGARKLYNDTFGSRYRLANAIEMLPAFKNEIVSSYMGAEVNNGSIEFNPANDSDIFRMDGYETRGDEKLDAETYAGKYKIEGIVTAGLTSDNKGNGQLLMEITDDKGNIKTDEMKDYVQGLNNGNVAPVLVAALRNEESGIMFYKKIEMDQATQSKIMSDLGSSAILNDEIEAENRLADETAVIEEQMEQNGDMVRENILTLDSNLENNPVFQEEAFQYANQENPKINRSSLMKSFYLFSSQGQDLESYPQNGIFDKMIKAGGPEIETLFKTYGHNMSDEELIDKWLLAVNSDLEDTQNPEQAKQNNDAIAQTWKWALKEYNKSTR